MPSYFRSGSRTLSTSQQSKAGHGRRNHGQLLGRDVPEEVRDDGRTNRGAVSMAKRYFSHAEISPTCLVNHGGPVRAFEAALRAIEPVLKQLLARFRDDPETAGRIVLSAGWNDKKPSPPLTERELVAQEALTLVVRDAGDGGPGSDFVSCSTMGRVRAALEFIGTVEG